tara:strand:- start:25238 stop:25453 length:216 start_codon:yes stop_codon:yes gene_type:complete
MKGFSMTDKSDLNKIILDSLISLKAKQINLDSESGRQIVADVVEEKVQPYFFDQIEAIVTPQKSYAYSKNV